MLPTLFVIRRPNREGPVVADGVVFPDGQTVLAWRGEHRSIVIYPSPETCLAVRHHATTWLLSVPEGWDMSVDPWHADAFKGTPGEGVVGTKGKRRAVWLALDAWGNAIGNAGPVVPIAGTKKDA